MSPNTAAAPPLGGAGWAGGAGGAGSAGGGLPPPAGVQCWLLPPWQV
jgi:hypothetical protein